MLYRLRRQVEAIQLHDDNHHEVLDWLGFEYAGSPALWKGESVMVDTVNGRVLVRPGDYITREIIGSLVDYGVYDEESFNRIFTEETSERRHICKEV